MITHLARFPTIYRVVIGPDIDQVLLRALGEHLDGESIPVSLSHDPATPDQRPTIAILLDSRNMRRLLGAEPRGGSDGVGVVGDYFLSFMKRRITVFSLL